MAQGKTYGITFHFRDSFDGKYLDLTDFDEDEIKTDLIHLLLTRKGSRYFLPNFGTRLYEYIFEPLDGPTFNEIETEIKDSVTTYIPNLQITSVKVEPIISPDGQSDFATTYPGTGEITLPDLAINEHTAKVTINYNITSGVFNTSDFIIINI
jgi:phage baseplate assembly protein W